MIFIDVGAGSLDEGTENMFYKFVNNYDKSQINKIVCVEPNEIHLKAVAQRYKEFNNLEIFNVAIVADKKMKSEKLYYSPDDKPDFQTASLDKDHVIKHFPNSEILTKEVKCLEINLFLDNFINQKIQYLKLDIEGLDEKVIQSTNFRNYDINYISIEKLHFNQKFKTIFYLLRNFYLPEFSVKEVSRFDILFKKVPRNSKNLQKVLTLILHLTLERIYARIYNFSFKKIRKYEI